MTTISEISTPLFFALLVGGMIGLERSHSGHAAGLRTYSLVSLASAMLMWVATTTSTHGWSAAVAGGTMLSDPSRVVQGILTGIGFLGAGVIVKDGFTVRGLTTAASIWVTASLGILVGSGQYIPALVATVMAMAALTTFRKIESRISRRRYVRFNIVFRRQNAMVEKDLRDFVAKHGYVIEDVSYELNGGGTTFEYHVNMWSLSVTAHSALVHAAAKMPDMLELRVVPSRD
jgi:putative Mg2+ transporter-C (MgtC) family protein